MKIRSLLLVAAATFALGGVASPLAYSYRIEAPQKVVEKKPGSLNDGNAKTFAYWKGPKGVVMCELPSASYVKEVAVTLRKSTKWYLMNEVEVAVDADGSGEFAKPVAVPVNIPMCDGKSPTIDASCTNMTVRLPVEANAVRVKVVVKTQAWGAISEIVLDDGKAGAVLAAKNAENAKSLKPSSRKNGMRIRTEAISSSTRTISATTAVPAPSPVPLLPGRKPGNRSGNRLRHL